MLALAILAAAAPVPPPSEDEIVVVAQKMRMIDVDLKAPMRHGKLILERCGIRQTTGYAEIDAVPCEVAHTCMTTNPATRRALETCVEEGSQTRLDAIVAAWREARR